LLLLPFTIVPKNKNDFKSFYGYIKYFFSLFAVTLIFYLSKNCAVNAEYFIIFVKMLKMKQWN